MCVYSSWSEFFKETGSSLSSIKQFAVLLSVANNFFVRLDWGLVRHGEAQIRT